MRNIIITLFIFMLTILRGDKVNCQTSGSFPPFTKWYQDPLGSKPFELSSAFGFAWGVAGVTACFIFTKSDSAFRKKTSVYQEAGFSFGYKAPYTCVLQNEIGLMFNFRKWMTLGIGWNVFHFNDRVNNTLSFGFRPFARWYPYRSKKLSLFFEYGAGVSYSINKFPLTGTNWKADTARVGTRFNFTSKYGIGAEIYLTKKLSLQAGVRHFHLSNGNLAGIKRNPSHDSNGPFAGLIYKLNSR